MPFGFSIETDFSGEGLLFLALLILGIVFIFMMNNPRRITRSHSESWLTWVIPFTRTMVLIILLLLVITPQLSIHRQYSIPKRIAIVLDDSRSMPGAWEGNLAELQNSISKSIGVLKSSHPVEVWTMSGQAIDHDKITFDNSSSVFDWNPTTINGSDDGDIYSSVFLFTDGHLNGGRSPLDLEWSKSLEVNIIYPLQPKSNALLKLVHATYSTDDLNSGEIQINGSIHQEGLIGRRARVQFYTELDELLAEESFQLNQSFQDLNVSLRISNQSTSRIKMKLFLDAGEFLTEQFLEITQGRTKPSILIASERINDLHKFLIQSFADSSYQLYVIQGTKRVDTPVMERSFPDKFDLVVLNSPGERVLAEISETTFRLENLANTPLVMFYDGIDKLPEQWINLLGIKGIHSNDSALPQTGYWTENSKNHALYLGLLGRGYSPNDLMEYAPLGIPAYGLEMEGVHMISTGIGTAKLAALMLSDRPPRAIFSGKGYWRWFFHPQSKSSFSIFWEYLLIYLQEITSFTPVQIDLPTTSAATGSYIVADVTIKDLDNRNIKAAELRVWQEDESNEKKSLNLTRSDNGIYEAQLDTKYPGEQLIIAEAYRYGELWGRDTSRIHLMSFNGEDQSQGVDEVFLARIASRSGGQVILFRDGEMPYVAAETIKRESSFHFRGVRSAFLFSALLVLLTFEWIWRRRSGLL